MVKNRPGGRGVGEKGNKCRGAPLPGKLEIRCAEGNMQGQDNEEWPDNDFLNER